VLKRTFFSLLILTVSALFFSAKIQAGVEIDVTVSGTVPNATVTFSGFAPPSSAITIKEGVTTVGTTVTNASGSFSKVVISTPGSHDFSLTLIDTAGRSTPATSVSGVVVVNQSNTPVASIHMPPTIALSKSTIVTGDSTLIYGQGAPSSTVRVYLNGSQKFSGTIAGSGSWQFTLSSGYNIGSNTIYAKLTRVALSNSVNSFTKTLTVDDCARSDLNCDGYVNLTDFSILLYYWNTTNANADINEDGIVSLIDFSIMMFDWTG